MNKRKRYFRAFLAFLLIAGCAATAVVVPEKTAAWYDAQTLGAVEYADMEYQPYQISYFDSFDEKVEAVAACQAGEGRIYALELGEHADIITDKKLQELVNAQLKDLYQAGVLPEQLQAESVIWRSYLEYCLVMENNSGESRRNIYVWNIGCDVEGGTLTLQMDSEYHRIYSFTLSTKEKGTLSASGDWLKFLTKGMNKMIPDAWMDYWELKDASYYMDYSDSSMANKKTGEWGYSEYVLPLDFVLDMPAGNAARMHFEVVFFSDAGWTLHGGLQLNAM